MHCADVYLRPIGLSLRDRPISTPVVFGGIAFAVGALWVLRQDSREHSRWDDLVAQFNEYSRRSRS